MERLSKPSGFNKRSEYNRNYYEKHRESIIEKHLEYYHQNKEMIIMRNKDYYVNYYQQNKQRILTRVQNNYYNKIHGIKKKNEILEPSGSIELLAGASKRSLSKTLDSNIIIRLMD